LGRVRRPRVLIADDHTLVAESFRKLLESDFDVVGTVADGRALLRAVPALEPDVILVDIGMPLLNGLDAGEQVKQKAPGVKLLYLTMNQDADIAAEAFRRGASGYLLKTGAPSELVSAIRDVLKGRSYVSRQIAKDLEPTYTHSGKLQSRPKLTPRQKEVLQLLAEGCSMKEVAGVLNLTPRTVAFHKYRVMEVLRLKSNTELVQYAIRNRMISG
jgi:DNA-binding NarL/FixJ family response regulator